MKGASSLASPSPPPPPKAESTRVGCSGPCPVSFESLPVHGAGQDASKDVDVIGRLLSSLKSRDNQGLQEASSKKMRRVLGTAGHKVSIQSKQGLLESISRHVKDQVIGISQQGLTRAKPWCTTNLIASHNEMTGFVAQGRAMDIS